jgi:hypothetical protein
MLANEKILRPGYKDIIAEVFLLQSLIFPGKWFTQKYFLRELKRWPEKKKLKIKRAGIILSI